MCVYTRFAASIHVQFNQIKHNAEFEWLPPVNSNLNNDAGVNGAETVDPRLGQGDENVETYAQCR